MNNITAIETKYNDVVFRSRLEARWALFFDLLGVEWLYEFEGYKTPTELYVPDFWLPQVYMRDASHKGVLLEVKPDNYEPSEHAALEYVASQLNVSAMLVKGFYPDNEFGGDNLYQIAQYWDTPMLICKCEHCGAVKFEYPEGSYEDCPMCNKLIFFNPIVLSARKQALAYRFW